MKGDVTYSRIHIFTFLLGILTLLLLGRFAHIMLFPKELSKTSVTPSFPELQRGAIYDRNGKLMAIQTRLDSVTAWLPHVKDPSQTALLLGKALGLDIPELEEKLSQPQGGGFLYIKRLISPTESRRVKELIQKGEISGINLEPELGRNYPEQDLASHVIGYVGTDNVGLDGIEYTYNSILAPPELAKSGEKVVYGNDIYLTLDLNTQYITERIAQAAMTEHNPKGLMILVMGAQTGEIYSFVSLPSFNPNTFSRYSQKERTDLPVTFTYEPGSAIKVFSLAGFLELEGITLEDQFSTSGGYNPEFFQQYNIQPIRDLGDYGVLTTTDILIRSSNVGTALASDRVGAQEFYSMMRNFGFGQKTGIPLPGESSGILADPRRWSLRSKPTIAMGQEIGVSAMQVITAATTFANSGKLLRPRIVDRVVSPNGEVILQYEREVVREVLSPEVAEAMLLMMEQVVSAPNGTVWRARVPGLRISAKSGTAQLIDPVTGNYSDSDYVGSVLALFPTENPQLIVYVVLHAPRGYSTYGGRIAGPIVRQLAEELAPYYGIPIQGNTLLEHDGTVVLPPPRILAIGQRVPDFTGLSKREVMATLEGTNIPITLSGEGWVTFQFPPAGEVIDTDTALFLEFR